MSINAEKSAIDALDGDFRIAVSSDISEVRIDIVHVPHDLENATTLNSLTFWRNLLPKLIDALKAVPPHEE